MGAADWARLLFLALLWGSAFFLIEVALQGAGPFTIVFFRVAIAALAMQLYVRMRRQTLTYTPSLIASFLLMGFIAAALPFTLIALGQTRIESGLTAILIATTPMFTVVIGHLWGRIEPATAGKVGGVAMGLAGVVMLMGDDILQGLSGTTLGKAAVLAAAASYAASAVYGRRYQDLPPAAVAASMLTAASLFMAPVAFLLESPLRPLPGASVLIAIAALALLSTALAFLLYFTVLASAGATNAMLVTFIQPAVAVLLGVMFLNESLSAGQAGGMALILVGLALVDGRPLSFVARRLKRDA